jgi:hypothetical protein
MKNSSPKLELTAQPRFCKTVVSGSFSLMILEAEYHKLKLEIFKAEKEMALSPNEYSDNFLVGYKPHLQDLEKAISVLQNCG